MYRIIFFSLIVIVSACISKRSNKCLSSYDSIIKEKNKFSPPIKEKNGGIFLKDIGIENANIGGEYKFDRSKKLEYYKFYTNENNYSYAVYFNKNGEIDSVEGNPILISNVDEIHKDSIVYNFYISTLGNEITKFSITLNSSEWITLKGKNDSVFSNVLRFDAPFNTKGIKALKIIEKLEYFNCEKKDISVLDSTYIERI